MHSSGYGFASGSEDKTARFWDIRSDQQVAEYKPPTPNSGFTSCGLSKSGRYIFCGSDDNQVHVWDTLKCSHTGKLYQRQCSPKEDFPRHSSMYFKLDLALEYKIQK